MYKVLVDALCSCKYAKSAVTRPKSFTTGQISYSVRRYSKKLSPSNYTKEDSEFPHEQKYSSQTRKTKVSKSPKTWSKEYNNQRYEKYARQPDNDWNYETTPNYDNDTFYDGVGIFKEISDEDKTFDKPSGKKQTKRHSQPNWSDEFGTLVTHEDEQLVDENDISDVEDDAEEDKILNHFRLARYNRRHIPNWYARKIQKFGKQGEIKKAIEVFDEWMIKNDRVKPTQFEYGVLMKLLADVGYTEKAFKLYNDMLGRQIYADDRIYTCLFNACANSPCHEDGLNLAKYLRHKMLYKDKKPTYITYLSMIKAFGFCGDINMAFKLADEAALLHIDSDLLNNLLTACISDKEAGFRHAIVVWRKFRTLGVKPNLNSYNLLLHCVAECGVGDPDLVKRLFNQPINNIEKKTKIRKNRDLIEGTKHTSMDVDKINADNLTKSAHKNLLNSKLKRSTRKSFAELDQLMVRYGFGTEVQGQDTEFIDNISDISNEFDSDTVAIDNNKEWWQQDIFENSVSTLAVQKTEVTLTNLSNDTSLDILDPSEDLQCSVDVSTIKDSSDRLSLLGGMNGILQTLEENQMKPDKATFGLLARSIPAEYVNLFISKMWAMGVKPDIVIYNNFIHELICAKNEPDIAWALYERLTKEELIPDIRTFSILAFACRKTHDGLKLIDDMLAADIMPNIHTMHALLHAAYLNFNYKIAILRKMNELGIQCDAEVIRAVEKHIQKARCVILRMEHQALQKERTEKNKQFFDILKQHRTSLDRFLHFYEKWLKKQNIAVKPHPWQAFKPEEKE